MTSLRQIYAGVLCGVLVAGAASAHHFKGLPHFGYFENYPQVPQEEFLAQAGDYEFSLVIYDFQGISRPDTEAPDDVRLFLVIYNLRKNKAYQGPLKLEIMDGEDVLFEESLESSQEESLYRMQRVLPESGDYSLRVVMGTEPPLVGRIPFTLSSQVRNWAVWLVVGLVGLLVVVGVGARRARVLEDCREKRRSER